MSAQVCTCRFCGEGFQPQGIDTHETFCDSNPNPGISYDKQAELGILEDAEAEPPAGAPDPNQEREPEDGGLPPVTELSASKSVPPDDPEEPPEPDSCPNCGTSEVIPAEEMKDAYTERVEKPNGRAVLAFELSDWCCGEPECGTLWGAKHEEPVTMDEVLSA